ncbi:MAG: hypothetical protein FWD69_08970 [Polyangiaceae bacterium]|nr:hypothetical protein [Polyangiaceae bacterium]
MRSIVIATMFAISSLVAVPAFAAPAQGGASAKVHHGDHAKFPMSGAEFKQKVDARQAKARARMEERASKLPADQANALRAKFEAGTATINAEVDKIVADGTVTEDEAKEFREVVRSVFPHAGKHHEKKS